MLSPSTPVCELSGIGPKRTAALEKSGIATVGQLVEWLPRRYLDRSAPVAIRTLEPGIIATIVGTVAHISKPRGRKGRLVLTVRDETGALSCTWFGVAHFMAKRFEPGQRFMLTGKVSFYNGLQMIHPEIERISDDLPPGPAILPLYPTPMAWGKAHFDSRMFRKWVSDTLDTTRFPDPLLPDLIARQVGFRDTAETYRSIHFPQSLEQGKQALRLFQFQELFVLAYALLRRKRANAETGASVPASTVLKPALLNRLAFRLTSGQERVLAEIEEDIIAPRRMARLLQGDVGSGKTIVALIAALHYIENGRQVAVLAPTEILAQQHFRTFADWLSPFNVACVLLTGQQTRKEQEQARTALKTGAPLAVGTHALLTETTEFRDLGLSVVDEQHRFGVEQRLALGRKGKCPDMLVMSATPIPRSVALVIYGDLDISVLDEKPPGRQEVKTRIVAHERRPDLMTYLRTRATEGRRLYYIVPRVEESEDDEIASAIETAARFKAAVFQGIGVALVHGRLKGPQKTEALSAFREGRSPILVSTSVVEVGMDVKEADCMVIEHPERFGLSQLHQLRGRVGRGRNEAYCFLLPSVNAAPESLERLREFCATADGFRIAELDLEPRGPGDIAGVRQSGLVPGNRASPFLQTRLFVEARAWAQRVIEGRLLSKKEQDLLDRTCGQRFAAMTGGSGAA